MVSSIGSSSDMQQLMALMMQKMNAADTDGTAGLSKSELSSVNAGDDVGGANFLSALSKNFDKIDANGDGQLSNSEISSTRPSGQMGPPPGLQIESDSDSDDSSTVKSKDATGSTDSTSSKKNTVETLMEKLLAALQESLVKSYGGDTSTSANSSSKDAVSSLGKLDFSAADVDGTSGLSKTELSSVDTKTDPGAQGFLNELSKNFDSVDTNKDGQLSTDEISAVSKGHKSESTSSSASSSSTTDTLKNLADSFIQQLLDSYKDKLGEASSALNLAV